MPKIPTAPLTFYPAYCFHLSPTYSTWTRLTATDVYTLRERVGFEGQNLYFHLNHPIKWIRLVGLVVTFDIHPQRFLMILDDSSGSTIEITCGRKTTPLEAIATDTQVFGDKRNESKKGIVTSSVPDTTGVTATGYDIDLHGIDIGSVVKVKGGIGDFRGERQILLERISTVRTTTEEAAAWAENVEFRRIVLDRPWTVSEKEQAAAKRKEDGRDRREAETRLKERKASVNGRNQSGTAAMAGGIPTARNRERRVEDKRRWKLERKRGAAEKSDRQRKEQELMKTIEQEDADMRRREEANRKMAKELDDKRKEAEKKERQEAEERGKREMERKQRNEARERALREMGAGR